MPARKLPKATMVRENSACTCWTVKWPGRPGYVEGKTYRATTYPDSDLIFIETGARRVPVTGMNATKLTPIIRAAIERARA